MPLNYKKTLPLHLLTLFKDLDLTVIDRFLESVSTHIGNETKILNKTMSEWAKDAKTDEQIEALQDHHQYESFYLEQIPPLSQELAIVALYKKIELMHKKSAQTALPGIPANTFYKIDNLIKALKKQGINIETLPHYSAMDEVRCLNNDIKHSGKVGSLLAKYPGWTLGHTLENLDAAYQRLSPLCEKYASEYIDELIKVYKQNHP